MKPLTRQFVGRSDGYCGVDFDGSLGTRINLFLNNVLNHFMWCNIYRMHIGLIYMRRLLFKCPNLVDYIMSKELHTTEPREQSGRDSFERYQAQVRSASIAALTILEGTEVDRIYCDLHDDFVKRRVNGGGYDFFQVKTKAKQNQNWKLLDVFGIKSKSSKQSPDSIKDSFIGKLLLHTIIFDENCNSVVFQTNINNEDHIEDVLEDIQSGEFSNKYTKILIDNFNNCISQKVKLSDSKIKENLSKLKFENDVQYLKSKNNNYEAIVRQAIYDYSEVDLSYTDNQEIIKKLLELVTKKSSGKIENWTLDSIEEQSGISIDDLLSILSISRDAYLCLKGGGDSSAIKNISIIQRFLKDAGADDSIVEYCSKCKLDWDLWRRNNRHNIFELDLNYVTKKVSELLNDNLESNGGLININDLRVPIKNLISHLDDEDSLMGLDNNLIVGAIFSEIVKRKS